MEVELKLLVGSTDIDAVRKSPLLRKLQSAPPREVDHHSIYFDTPDLTMYRHQAGLRLRCSDGHWVQTFKGGGNVIGGLHSRNEFECAVNSQMLDLPALRQLAGKGNRWHKMLGRESVRKQLAPIFQTRIHRTVWQLRTPAGAQIECVLDLGTVTAGDHVVQISEIELELKDGLPHALFAVALGLLDEVPLRLGNTSKAGHGYALLRQQAAGLDKVKPAPIHMAASTNVEDAFIKLVQDCLAQMQSHEDAVLTGGTGEPLHCLRVALRKLQGVFGLFRREIPLPEALADEFAWLAGVLGPARDWDVLLHTTLPHLPDSLLNQIDLLRLVRAASDSAGEAAERAAAALAGPRYTRLLLQCQQWLLSSAWRNHADAKLRSVARPVSRFAADACERLATKLRRRRKKAVNGDQRARHRTRIAAKNLRYAVEFFAPLYPDQRIKPVLKALAALQDQLGTANDLTVAERLLAHLAQTHVSAANDVDCVRTFLTGHQAGDGRLKPKAWRRFDKLRLPHGR